MSNNKETLEQAAERYGKEYYRKDKPANTYTFHEGFKTGAQYEQSRIVTLLEERRKITTDKYRMFAKQISDEIDNLLKLIKE